MVLLRLSLLLPSPLSSPGDSYEILLVWLYLSFAPFSAVSPRSGKGCYTVVRMLLLASGVLNFLRLSEFPELLPLALFWAPSRLLKEPNLLSAFVLGSAGSSLKSSTWQIE